MNLDAASLLVHVLQKRFITPMNVVYMFPLKFKHVFSYVQNSHLEGQLFTGLPQESCCETFHTVH